MIIRGPSGQLLTEEELRTLTHLVVSSGNRDLSPDLSAGGSQDPDMKRAFEIFEVNLMRLNRLSAAVTTLELIGMKVGFSFRLYKHLINIINTLHNLLFGLLTGTSSPNVKEALSNFLNKGFAQNLTPTQQESKTHQNIYEFPKYQEMDIRQKLLCVYLIKAGIIWLVRQLKQYLSSQD